jgi:hypothetical protein
MFQKLEFCTTQLLLYRMAGTKALHVEALTMMQGLPSAMTQTKVEAANTVAQCLAAKLIHPA